MNSPRKPMRTGFVIFWACLLCVVLAVGIVSVYLFWPHMSNKSHSGVERNWSATPVGPEHVKYLLQSLGAEDLHAPFYNTHDTPKMDVIVDHTSYRAEVIDGEIIIEEGSFENSDLSISTSAPEVLHMLENSSYVSTSFREGTSRFEVYSTKSTLVAKGYLGIYNSINAKPTQ